MDLPPPFTCAAPIYVTDGDTIRCADGTRVRIARIDAPEMRGHCQPGRHCAPGDPIASRDALVDLIGRNSARCTPVSASTRGGGAYDRWGRIVARCSVNGDDIGEYMIAGGFAIVWPHR